MENLNEMLTSIQKSGKTIAEKKQMCIELGLRKRDIEVLEFAGFFDGKSLTFGVEIECNVFKSSMLAAARANNVQVRYEGYNHDDNDYYYKFTTDSSVRGDSPIECVSPILKDNTDGHGSLKAACKALNDARASVNTSCGLHVHVGVEDLSDEAYINIFKNYQKLEYIIDSFMAPSRRGECNWAHSIQRFDFDHCYTKLDVREKMGSRYFKVNPMSYSRHKTVEFRQHQGTVNYDKISMWVNFCLKLVSWSMDHTLDHMVNSVSEIPFLDDSEKRFFSGRRRTFQGA